MLALRCICASDALFEAYNVICDGGPRQSPNPVHIIWLRNTLQTFIGIERTHTHTKKCSIRATSIIASKSKSFMRHARIEQRRQRPLPQIQ